MIVVEGPDGAGKTQLVSQLTKSLGLPIHERSANSDASATLKTEESRGANLAAWAFRDVISIPDQPLSIYDRHCLISEYVYGPILRGYIDPNMLSPTMHLSIRNLAKYSLVIFCRPPDNEILKNLSRDETSKKVVGDNGIKIAAAYDALRMFWPGESKLYDYTKPYAYFDVLNASRLHVARFNQEIRDA